MFKKGAAAGRGNRGTMRIAGLADKLQDSCQEQIYEDLTDARPAPYSCS